MVSVRKHDRWMAVTLVAVSIGLARASDACGQEQQKKAPPTPGPMLQDGYLELKTPTFELKLVKSSQTAAALVPKSDTKFDFTPGDLLIERSQDGYYHLGDLDLRLREGSAGEWKGYSTALARQPVATLA